MDSTSTPLDTQKPMKEQNTSRRYYVRSNKKNKVKKNLAVYCQTIYRYNYVYCRIFRNFPVAFIRNALIKGGGETFEISGEEPETPEFKKFDTFELDCTDKCSS